MKQWSALAVILIAMMLSSSSIVAQGGAVVVDPSIGNGSEYGTLFVEEYFAYDYQYVSASRNPHNDESVIIARGASSESFSLMSINWQTPDVDWAVGPLVDWVATEDDFVLVSDYAQVPYATRIDNQGETLWTVSGWIHDATSLGAQVLLEADGLIYAVDLESGSEVWRFEPPIDQEVLGIQVVGDALVVRTINQDNGAFVSVVDAETGGVRWSTDRAGVAVHTFRSLIVVYDDYDYNGRVYRLDTGQELTTLTNDWVQAESHSMFGTYSSEKPDVSNVYDAQTGDLLIEFPGKVAGFIDTLAIAYEYTSDGSFARAYDPRSGEMVWEFQSSSDFTVLPSARYVRVATLGEGVYLLDGATGNVLGHWVESEALYSILSDGLVLANEHVIRRLDLAGDVSWTAELSGPVRTLYTDNDRVIAESEESGAATLYGLNMNTGEQDWNVELPEPSRSGTWDQRGAVLHLGMTTHHVALDTISGRVLWQATTVEGTQLVRSNGDSALLAVWTEAKDRVLQIVIVGRTR
jgi:outer membrane protein assembly factor BamB